MKSRIIYGLLIAVCGILFVPNVAHSVEFLGDDDVTISEDETIADDLYIGAGTITLLGTVEGDVIAGGGQLFINGTITQDITAAGGQITLEGSVEEDVRVAGGEISVLGFIGDSLAVAGGTVNVRSGATIGGDMTVAGGDVSFDGAVNGDVHVNGGHVTLNGSIDGDVRVRTGELEIGPNAEIAGTVTYRATSEATISPDASIAGEVEFNQLANGVDGWTIAGVGIVAFAFRFLALLAGAFVLWLVTRTLSQGVVTRGVGASWWRYLLIGFGVFVLMPIAAIVLFITVVGVPLGLFLMFAFITSLVVSWLYAPILLGSLITKWASSDGSVTITWASVFMGVFLYSLLIFIPIIGWVAQAFVFLMALGAFTAALARRVRSEE